MKLIQKLRSFPRYVLSSNHRTVMAIFALIVLFIFICNYLPVVGAVLLLSFFVALIYVLLYLVVEMIREM